MKKKKRLVIHVDRRPLGAETIIGHIPGRHVCSHVAQRNNTLKAFRPFVQIALICELFPFIPGMNSRLDELQAAILRVKLRHLDEDNAARRRCAEQYTGALSESAFILPAAKSKEMSHVYHQYVLRSKERDLLKNSLQEAGIGTLIHYPVPVHQQPAYQKRLPLLGSLSRTESIAKEILSLPMFPELLPEQIETVTRRIQEWAMTAKT